MDFDKNTYLIKASDGSQIGINIEAIVDAERRLDDVAIVNVHSAAELLSTYNRAWLDLQRMTTLLTSEKLKAENSYKNTKALAKLDCTNEVLKARGHAKPSADLRDALSDLDPKVIEAKDRLDELKVLLMLLQGKQDAFREAFSAVKKLVDSGRLPLIPVNNRDNRPDTFDGPKPEPVSYMGAPDLPIEPNLNDDLLDLPDGFKA